LKRMIQDACNDDDDDIFNNTKKEVIISCGSGVSACHLFLALEECGRNNSNTLVYDGSWAEWGQEEHTPKTVPNNSNNNNK